MRSRLPLVLSLSLSWLTSCGGGGVATQVIVHFDADAATRARATAVRLTVVPRDAPSRVREEPLGGSGTRLGWPFAQPLEPLDGDAARGFELVAELLDAGGVFQRQRVRGEYVEGERLHLWVLFEAACDDVLGCDDDESCEGGGCVSACVDPSASERPVDPTRRMCDGTDGGGLDAGPDAGDAGSSCDCPCTGDRCVDGVCAPSLAMVDVRLGRSHGCAVGEDGSLWCWGNNARGQVGVESPSVVPAPVRVDLPAPVDINVETGIKVAPGYEHTCAILDEAAQDRLYCWGDDTSGQLGRGSTGSAPSATPTEVAGDIADWAFVEAGGWHTCAITVGQTLYCWGRNSSCQIGTPRIDCTSCPVDQVPVCEDPQPAPIAIESWRTILDVSAGGRHTMATWAPDGGGRIRLLYWGRNREGQLGQGDFPAYAAPDAQSMWDSFATVSCGDEHTCAVAADNNGEMRDPPEEPRSLALYCTGQGTDGQLGLGARDASYLNLGELGPPDGWVQMAAGFRHTCGRFDDGRTFCTGANEAGQLGLGDTTPSRVFLELPDLWTRITAGEDATCGLRDDGTVWCWGQFNGGRLGLGIEHGTANRTRPERVCFE